MKLSLSLAAALLTGLACTSANAATDTVTMNVSGTLTKPPCIMTSSKTLTVNFGSIRYDQVDSAAQVDVPVTMTCPPNSALNISVTASSALSDTVASAGSTNLGYSLLWKSDNSTINIRGQKRNVTNLNGAVDLSMKAKLVAQGTLSPGDFSASAVINIDYL